MKYFTQFKHSWKFLAGIALLLAIAYSFFFPLGHPSANASWQRATTVLDQQFISAVIDANYQPGKANWPLTKILCG